MNDPDNAQAVLQKVRELASEWEADSERSWHGLICNTYRGCAHQLRQVLQLLSEPPKRVAPSVVAGVGEHAMGVSSDEEIAGETAREIHGYESSDGFDIIEASQLAILTAIRKAKSLSEPKELGRYAVTGGGGRYCITGTNGALLVADLTFAQANAVRNELNKVWAFSEPKESEEEQKAL